METLRLTITEKVPHSKLPYWAIWFRSRITTFCNECEDGEQKQMIDKVEHELNDLVYIVRNTRRSEALIPRDRSEGCLIVKSGLDKPLSHIEYK